MTDIHLFTEENIQAQLKTAPYTLGFYTLRFYSLNRRPVNKPTDTISEFYLYPSGGTIRDSDFNIVVYSTHFDTYHGFEPPVAHTNSTDE